MKYTEQLLRKYELHNQEQDQSLDVVKRGEGVVLTSCLLQVRERSSAEIPYIFQLPKKNDAAIRRLRSYFQYIGLMKYKKATDMLLRLQEHNLA
jgi:hypothetical protein